MSNSVPIATGRLQVMLKARNRFDSACFRAMSLAVEPLQLGKEPCVKATSDMVELHLAEAREALAEFEKAVRGGDHA